MFKLFCVVLLLLLILAMQCYAFDPHRSGPSTHGSQAAKKVWDRLNEHLKTHGSMVCVNTILINRKRPLFV